MKEQNRLTREAHKQAAEAHRAAAVANRRRLALAEEQQAAAAAQLAADNAAVLQQARQEYKVWLRRCWSLGGRHCCTVHYQHSRTWDFIGSKYSFVVALLHAGDVPMSGAYTNLHRATITQSRMVLLLLLWNDLPVMALDVLRQLLCQHIEEAHQQHVEALQREWLAAKAAAQRCNDEETASARAGCGRLEQKWNAAAAARLHGEHAHIPDVPPVSQCVATRYTPDAASGALSHVLHSCTVPACWYDCSLTWLKQHLQPLCRMTAPCWCAAGMLLQWRRHCSSTRCGTLSCGSNMPHSWHASRHGTK